MRFKFIYIIALIFTCCVSALSQVLLKKASQKKYSSFIKQYLNFFVVTGYCLFFFVLLMNIYILKFVPIIVCSVFSESLPLVLSFITGRMIFKEKITKTKVIGALFIIIGIFIVVV